MPEETVVSPASLNNAQRGQLAELIFIRKAASLGFAVAKPWNEGERYDAIVRVGHALWRVQVKSVLAKRLHGPTIASQRQEVAMAVAARCAHILPATSISSPPTSSPRIPGMSFPQP